MDKCTVARLMGHSSPRVAERYYIHVTEPHVAAGFERFLDYHAQCIVESVPLATERVQWRTGTVPPIVPPFCSHYGILSATGRHAQFANPLFSRQVTHFTLVALPGIEPGFSD